jgi:hypothetical protein
MAFININYNMTSFFRFVNKRAIYPLIGRRKFISTFADNVAHNLCCQIRTDDNSCTFTTGKSVTCTGACANEIIPNQYGQMGSVNPMIKSKPRRTEQIQNFHEEVEDTKVVIIIHKSKKEYSHPHIDVYECHMVDIIVSS